MRKRSTLKQLAESLDLSIATVSRALGGYDDIAIKTRERVRQQARVMGYVPNNAGRMLVSGRSGFVGLVVQAHGPDFMDSFLGQFVLGLGEGLNTHGTELFLAIAPEGQSELEICQKLVSSGRADALVLTRIQENDERVRYLLNRNIPFVTHGRVADHDLRYAWLDTDGSAAFAEAFERLFALGHRRFGLVSISDSMNARRHREAGLKRAMAERAGDGVQLQELHEPRADKDGLREAIAAMLSAQDRPTAIIGLFDELALIVIQEALRLGFEIPKDLSVIGFDNLQAAGLISPGLSTFDQDVRGSAAAIGGMVHELIDGGPRDPGEAPRTLLKTAKFVARGSHGPAPGC